MSSGPRGNAGARRARSEEARQAKLQAILDAAPPRLRERLLVEFLSLLQTPAE